MEIAADKRFMHSEFNLPSFTIDGYRNLIFQIKSAGFNLKPVSEISETRENSIYLRHDIDFSPIMATHVAEIEHSEGVVSTFFVLLNGPYNPMHQDIVAAIRKIISLGHEIGLHYDLTNWPKGRQEAEAKLATEIQILEYLTETKVNSIVMHQPSLGGEDYFAFNDCSWVNPTYYQNNDANLCYVSDSCRAWRDDVLVKFLHRKLPDKNRLMLNTHPENWLAEKKMNRISYLEKILVPKISQATNDYFLGTVRSLWETQISALNGIGDEDEN